MGESEKQVSVSRVPLNERLYARHSGVLIQLHISRKSNQSMQLEQQYKDAGSHGTYCNCYFCNPQI